MAQNQLQIAGEHLVNRLSEGPWSVSAGKLEVDQIEKNYKYIEMFHSIREALCAARSCQGYDFVELNYTDPDGRVWDVSGADIKPVYERE